MKVNGVRINWMLGWSNSPSIYLWVDILPKDIIMHPHRTSPTNILWYGEKDNLVRFYSDTTLLDSLKSKQEDGFAGRHFTILTENGKHILKGPWSSRAGVMNSNHPVAIKNHCVEVALTDEEEVFENGHTYWGSATTVSFVNEALQKSFDIQLKKELGRDSEEIYYIDKSLCDKPNCEKHKITDKIYEWKKRINQ